MHTLVRCAPRGGIQGRAGAADPGGLLHGPAAAGPPGERRAGFAGEGGQGPDPGGAVTQLLIFIIFIIIQLIVGVQISRAPPGLGHLVLPDRLLGGEPLEDDERHHEQQQHPESHREGPPVLGPPAGLLFLLLLFGAHGALGQARLGHGDVAQPGPCDAQLEVVLLAIKGVKRFPLGRRRDRVGGGELALQLSLELEHGLLQLIVAGRWSVGAASPQAQLVQGAHAVGLQRVEADGVAQHFTLGTRPTQVAEGFLVQLLGQAVSDEHQHLLVADFHLLEQAQPLVHSVGDLHGEGVGVHCQTLELGRDLLGGAQGDALVHHIGEAHQAGHGSRLQAGQQPRPASGHLGKGVPHGGGELHHQHHVEQPLGLGAALKRGGGRHAQAIHAQAILGRGALVRDAAPLGQLREGDADLGRGGRVHLVDADLRLPAALLGAEDARPAESDQST